MSRERKYQDHEIREILDLAIGEDQLPAKSLPVADGLTLVQLQDVGREVGLPPDRIAHAVAAFEGRGEAAPRGKTLGLPTSIGRVVPLPRNPTDREWELLIAELRTTFGGKGVLTSQGGLREWSHGTVHAFIEPTETGYRLRLTDSNAAVAGIVVGGLVSAFALMLFVILLGKADSGFKFVVPAMFGLLGVGMAVGSALALPKWAREQERRMEQISRRVTALLALPPASDE